MISMANTGHPFAPIRLDHRSVAHIGGIGERRLKNLIRMGGEDYGRERPEPFPPLDAIQPLHDVGQVGPAEYAAVAEGTGANFAPPPAHANDVSSRQQIGDAAIVDLAHR